MGGSGTGREKSKSLLGRKWTVMHANSIGHGARFASIALGCAKNGAGRVTDWSFLCIFGKPPAESRKRTHPHLQPRRPLRY